MKNRIHKIELQIRLLRLQVERFPQLNWAELTEYLDQTDPKASSQGLATLEALEKRVNEIEIPIQQMMLRLEWLPQLG
ncbi:MAG: hypothetical protein H6673_10100 [Anaerolineales bacterium]|nr:hypothetical protein [Anaerolineales bacterium]